MKIDEKLFEKHVKMFDCLHKIDRGPLQLVQRCNKTNFRLIKNNSTKYVQVSVSLNDEVTMLVSECVCGITKK